MNIVLIGYRCSGKTKVGEILARDMARGFVDMDRLIERGTMRSIRSFVMEKGWEHFRTLEKGVVLGLADSDNLVIATGGGVVTDRDNVRSLRRNGWIVWLKTSASIIKDRMKGENPSNESRPALTGTDAIEEIERILAERGGLYARASDYVVDTNERDAQEVARAIIEALPDTLRARG
jgi:shikimate kinase